MRAQVRPTLALVPALALVVLLAVVAIVPAEGARSTSDRARSTGLDFWSSKGIKKQKMVQVARRGKNKLFLWIQAEGLRGRYNLCVKNDAFGKKCRSFKARTTSGKGWEFGTSRINYPDYFPVRKGDYKAVWRKGGRGEGRRLAPTGAGDPINSSNVKHLRWRREGGKWVCSPKVPSCLP